MANILSQSEVTSLLAALDPGNARRVATQRSNAATGTLPGSRLHRFDPAAQAALQRVDESFAGELARELSVMTRAPVEVNRIGGETTTCAEFALSLENPTCLHRLQGTPLRGPLLLDLSPSIVFPLVDRLLGGGATIPSFLPHRSLTEIELRLLARIVDAALAGLQAAWSPYCALKLSVAQVFGSPQQLTEVALEAAAMVSRFEVSMGSNSCGLLSLCIPQVALESLESLESQLAGGRGWPAASGADAQGRNADQAGDDAGAKLVVYLASARLSADEIENLSEGDVILTERGSDEPVVICLDGQPRFEGSAGVLEGHKAVRIASERRGD